MAVDPSAQSPPRPEVPRSRLRVAWRYVQGPLLALVLMGVTFIVASGIKSSGAERSESASLEAASPLERMSIGQLAREADKHLTGGLAPSLKRSMRPILGFGDPLPKGRPTYRHKPDGFKTTWTPTLNSVVDIPNGTSDERKFLSVDASLVTDARQFDRSRMKRAVEAKRAEIIWLMVLVSNSAAPQNLVSCKAPTEPIGPLAKDVRLKVSIWNSTDNRFHLIRAWLIAANTEPRWISDAVAIRTERAATLIPDDSISRQYSGTSKHYKELPLSKVDQALNPSGLLLGEDGIVGTCWQDRYSLRMALRQHSNQ